MSASCGRSACSAAAKAQVDALQARIRPHFLFNSMNTIASLIRKRPADAERAVEDLSDLFRAALGARETLGTLGEELDLIGHYLRIESLRLGDRLHRRARSRPACRATCRCRRCCCSRWSRTRSITASSVCRKAAP